jgi:magnesium-transporting ATPase (P-type)
MRGVNCEAKEAESLRISNSIAGELKAFSRMLSAWATTQLRRFWNSGVHGSVSGCSDVACSRIDIALRASGVMWVHSMEASSILPENEEKLRIAEIRSRPSATDEGLSTGEREARLKRFGPNEIIERKARLLLKPLGYFWGPIRWVIEAAELLFLAVRQVRDRHSPIVNRRHLAVLPDLDFHWERH